MVTEYKRIINLLIFSLILNISLLFINMQKDLYNKIMHLINIITIIATMYYAYTIHKKITTQQNELQKNLEDSQNEIKKYEKIEKNNYILKEKNERLEFVNQKYSSTLEKYYNIQQIASAIKLIYDKAKLLNYINNCIVDIINCANSSIILFSDDNTRLVIESTNIEKDFQKEIEDLFNTSMFYDLIEEGSTIMENYPDENEFHFIKGRGIKSFIIIPISTNKRRIGFLLVESDKGAAFNEENAKVLTLISFELSIALENLHLYKKLKDMATIDELTGIHNRLYFQEKITHFMDYAIANNKTFTLGMFDIDHFKKVNDTYGHPFGDKALKLVTSIVKEAIDKDATFARYGGEEFIMLFPDKTKEEVFNDLEVVRQKMEDARLKYYDQEVSITCSFGIASYPEDAEYEYALIKAADEALYDAKHGGRNTIKLFNKQSDKV